MAAAAAQELSSGKLRAVCTSSISRLLAVVLSAVPLLAVPPEGSQVQLVLVPAWLGVFSFLSLFLTASMTHAA